MKVSHTHVVDNSYTCSALDYGYCFEISSIEQLCEYFMTVRMGMTADSYIETVKMLSPIQMEKYNPSEGPMNHFGKALFEIAESEVNRKTPRSLIEIISKLNSDSFIVMAQCIKEYGAIYIQNSGGFFPKSKSVEIKDRVYTDTFFLPDTAQIRVFRQEDGRHWYAKVGGVDVAVDGEQKWTSSYAATKAAKKFRGID